MGVFFCFDLKIASFNLSYARHTRARTRVESKQVRHSALRQALRRETQRNTSSRDDEDAKMGSIARERPFALSRCSSKGSL